MIRTIRFLFMVSVLLLPAGFASAQGVDATLVGTVTSADTGRPLADVNVFIATSLKGTTTDTDGRFRISGVPLGTLRLYVSFVGYEPQFKDVFLSTSGEYNFDFALKEAVVSVGEITVTSENKKWKQQLEKFTTLFIGETPNAEETKITNPEVMDFGAKGGEFKAQASEPLVIENKALGYRVKYFLKEFIATPNRTKYDGEPLFEEMQPESPEQAALWHKNREKAFYGSFRHFMLALLNDKVKEQGFEIFSRPASRNFGSTGAGASMLQGNQRFPIKRSEILKDGESPDQKILDFEGFVEIVYTKEEEDEAYLRWSNRPPGSRARFPSSMIQVEKGPAVVDLKGDVLDPYGVTFYGYLAFERVADEVPKEYRPWLE